MMKTKVSTMVAPRSFLVVIICTLLIHIASLINCAPTELSNNNESTEFGVYPMATIIESSTPPSNASKPWPPQKPSRSKHITNSNLYKKTRKDKGGITAKRPGRVGEKLFYPPSVLPTGYDVEKDNLSRTGNVKVPTILPLAVDNVNGPKDYTNKNLTNSLHPQRSIPSKESNSTNLDVDDDVGKDIDFISVAGTTKSDETYATASTTTGGYHAKAGVASTTATMQTVLVENLNFNAQPSAKMLTKSPLVENIKSISSAPIGTLTPAPSKSLPVNASVSSSVSLSYPQNSVTTTTTTIAKLDVGHDGVRITKKKQLLDKHFIASAVDPSPSGSGSLHLPIAKDNPWPLSKNKPTKIGKKLMEVPNGYLGPIMMKEKTFSVSHHGKKPKPSIVDQLRDKKLVEIIAPTALMEPTIKVKSSISPPEFVAIDGASLTVTTTTESPSAVTQPPPVPTAATTKEEELESETATTYFLVVTQDNKISAETDKPSADTEMVPMNAGEIETTLREIYTEVLNAMEGGSKKNSAVPEAVKSAGKPTQRPVSLTTTFSPTKADASTITDHNSGIDPQRSADNVSDRAKSSNTGHLVPNQQVADHVLPSNHMQYSQTLRVTPSTFNRVIPASTEHNAKTITLHGGRSTSTITSTLLPTTHHLNDSQHPMATTTDHSSTSSPLAPTGSSLLNIGIKVDASTITDHALSPNSFSDGVDSYTISHLANRTSFPIKGIAVDNTIDQDTHTATPPHMGHSLSSVDFKHNASTITDHNWTYSPIARHGSSDRSLLPITGITIDATAITDRSLTYSPGAHHDGTTLRTTTTTAHRSVDQASHIATDTSTITYQSSTFSQVGQNGHDSTMITDRSLPYSLIGSYDVRSFPRNYIKNDALTITDRSLTPMNTQNFVDGTNPTSYPVTGPSMSIKEDSSKAHHHSSAQIKPMNKSSIIAKSSPLDQHDSPLVSKKSHDVPSTTGDDSTITDHTATFSPLNEPKMGAKSKPILLPTITDHGSADLPAETILQMTHDLSNSLKTSNPNNTIDLLSPMIVNTFTSSPVDHQEDLAEENSRDDVSKIADDISTSSALDQQAGEKSAYSTITDHGSTSSPSVTKTRSNDDVSKIAHDNSMDHKKSIEKNAHELSSITDRSSTPPSTITHDLSSITDPSSAKSPLDQKTHDLPSITDRISTSLPFDFKDNLGIYTQTKTHDLSSISSTSSPMVHHDSSAVPSSTPSPITDMGLSDVSPTFATITSNSYVHQQSLKPTHDSEQTESKISDIQIEVYDSTVEPILASTNFKDNTGVHHTSSHATPKQSPGNNLPQERFTQYVVDKATDFATQDSNSVAKASGKPEPAAIEIHINVSEGFGNESEDLEFSYRQSDYRKVTSKKPVNTNFITLKPFEAVAQNETSNEAAEEIVVEIIDSNSNSTENSASRENLNVNPIFTFRSDDDSQVELKNVKYYPEDRPKVGTKSTDDFFVPHLGQQAPGAIKSMMDRDSDTIFYISNTEVKVGESLPTTNTYDAQLKKSRLESQFFPANYEERTKVAPQRYEEDIILSPLKNRVADPLKVVRGPLDISYVGESVMEVEQATVTTTVPPPISDVIIQPAILPEMAIGVPVIGELPPQIELKEIDFMPNFDGNKEESSIQYGGDLIDEGGAMGAGFDMDSYPLGLGQKNEAISSQMLLDHRVNHLKKDELSADLAGSSETTDGNDLLHRSNGSVNGSVIGEKMGNATAYSVMEEPTAGDRELHFADLHMLFTACLATLLPLVLSVFLAFGLRHLYRKYQTNPFNVMGHNSSTDPLDAEKGTGGGDTDVDGVETPEELRASSLAFGATTDSASLEIITNSNEVKGKASDGVGRDCNGIVANGRAPTDMDIDCIQAIIPDNFQEENAIFIVNCNIESQTEATPAIQPQSATITTSSNVAASPPTAGTMQCNYSGANGSITTMTLKNNHLIVETEERNDISRDARETKMHYNNSEKDGVFVVEVSRGADSKIMPGSPVADPEDKRHFNIDAAVKIMQEDDKLEAVQVHQPPAENMNIHDEIESNHLHQIDEVDEFEEGPKISKHSNTGLSQSDLSSSSSVDSNKRYSYGNQELYTIEQQDYTTPSPAATKAPHPHTEPQRPQPENHNDDNGHSENGHCMENGGPTTPNCDSIYPTDTATDVNGHNGVESKPKITAALLKQDTVIVNEMTNGLSHNGNEDDEATPHNSMENLSNGLATIIQTVADYGGGDTENGFDSIISLPDPPSTEEMKQMNDIILMDTNQLDSLPPPPPPGAENHQHHNGNGIAPDETENGDSHSLLSSASPMNTPTKVVSSSSSSAAASLATNIPHTNGNCMTGHTTTSTAVAVEVSGSS